jgi:hypothetical protein
MNWQDTIRERLWNNISRMSHLTQAQKQELLTSELAITIIRTLQNRPLNEVEETEN